MEIPRTKIVGRVVGKPGISIGRGISCRLNIEVDDGEGSYETYELVIMRGSKPWTIREGTMVCATGILKGDTLWCDSFWRY